MEFLKRYPDIYAVEHDEDQVDHVNSVASLPTPQPSQQIDNAAAALNLVAHAAAAVRGLEEEATEAVVRARHLADALMKKLDLAGARVEDAEKKLHHAEAQVSQLTSAWAESNGALSTLRQEMSAKEAELAAAERRADEAEAAIQRITDAINTQLLSSLNAWSMS